MKMITFTSFAAFFAVILFAGGTIAAQALVSGEISVRYNIDKGAEMHFAGVPVFRSSSIQLYEPGWKRSFYTSHGGRVEPKVTDDAITIAHAAPKVKFAATETIRKTGENRIELALAGQLDSDVDARMEWAIGIANAFALYGGSVSALSSDALRPIFPEPATQRNPSHIVSNATGVRVTTRVGRIELKVEEGPADLVVIDGRRSPTSWWQEEAPSLWMGMLGVAIKPGEKFSVRVSIEFKPNSPRNEARVVAIGTPAIAVPQAVVPHGGPVWIIPTPKSMEWRAGEVFHLAAEVKIVTGDKSAERAARSLARQLERRYGIGSSSAEAPSAGAVTMLLRPQAGLPAESYELEVSGKGVTLAAPDAAGLYYGAQTLAQMIEADASGMFIRGAMVKDEPSLKFRGVHLFTGRDSLDFFNRLSSDVIGHFKFNHLVIEAEYTEWNAAKDIWTKQSVPTAQVAEYVRIAGENSLAAIPLVQSLGHMGWMFRNGKNLDLAEDPQTPWAYSVTNPQTYDFIHAIYAETLELFGGPGFFHIGHDEVAIRGRYPYREEAVKWGESKLFEHDVNKHQEFFSPRGARQMLWGDMLLHRSESNDSAANAPSREEAKRRRDALPRDVVICDWHYDVSPPAAYKSLKVLGDEGFKTIACSWYTPDNIANLAEAARMYGAWGLLQTTWAGYHHTQETMERDVRQFSAYVLAAEYAWSGKSPRPGELPWRAEEIFARAMSEQRELTRPLPGTQVDLSPAANMKLAHWLGFDSAGPAGLQAEERVAGVSFAPATSAIVLAGKLLPRELDAPAGVALKTDIASAGEVVFLHATAFPAPAGEIVGAYEIVCADGSREKIPLRYGREICAWNDPAPASRATAGRFDKSANGLDTALRLLRWSNPHPGRTVTAIGFESRHAYASPMLLGVTAISAVAR